MAGNAWYVLQSKPRQEALARENLERQGYTAYLPMMRARKRLRGKWTSVIEPMFPRYLFVELTPYKDDFGPLRSTRGVASVVRFGMEPAIMPAEIIAELRARECPETGVVEPRSALFKAGQNVEILNGPFQGLEAVFAASSSEERVILMLNVLGQKSRVMMPAADIKPVAV
ncbi:MAG: transcription/translation regulatory transformer protein RfaH [Thiotrichales bacterium]